MYLLYFEMCVLPMLRLPFLDLTDDVSWIKFNETPRLLPFYFVFDSMLFSLFPNKFHILPGDKLLYTLLLHNLRCLVAN